MVKQNQVPNEASLADLLTLERKNTFLSMSCHHIGTIQSFNLLEQTATATINYKKIYFDQDGSIGDATERLEDYPVLLDCPVIFLGGGKAGMTFPVAEGDECLVLFNDRDFSDWFNGSSDSPPPTLRLHAFSDGIILVGVRSLANVLTEFSGDSAKFFFRKDSTTVIGVTASATGAQLAYGTKTVIEAKEAKITFKNENNTLKAIAQDLCDKIKDLVTQLNNLGTQIQAITVTYAPGPGTPVPSGPPLNASAIATTTSNINNLATAFNTIKTNFGDLLE